MRSKHVPPTHMICIERKVDARFRFSPFAKSDQIRIRKLTATVRLPCFVVKKVCGPRPPPTSRLFSSSRPAAGLSWGDIGNSSLSLRL